MLYTSDSTRLSFHLIPHCRPTSSASPVRPLPVPHPIDIPLILWIILPLPLPFHHRRVPTLLPNQRQAPIPTQCARQTRQSIRTPEAVDNDDERERDGGGPEGPLRGGLGADVRSVHAEDGGDGADGKEDDGYDGENVYGAFLAVFVLLNVLFGLLRC